MVEIQLRIAELREKTSAQGIDACLIQKPVNRYYFSGFSGSAGTIVITPLQAYLLTDFRYLIQAKEQAPHLTVVEYKENFLQRLEELLKNDGVKKLAFEEDFIRYHFFQELQTNLSWVDLVPMQGIAEKMRSIKDGWEIAQIKVAVELADAAFDHILKVIKPGLTEREVALELEFFMRRQGASGLSFETIVASGYRGALPHGIATEKELQAGEMVVMDFGCVFEGYCSDITRTVALGKIDRRQEEIYQLVARAQKGALEGLRPGMSGKEGDFLARQIIDEAGYQQHFGHGLGHGVGLEVHELPRLSPSWDGTIAPGNVVTVEPGVYLENWGGVRIEDMVLITAGGLEILTAAAKELVVL